MGKIVKYLGLSLVLIVLIVTVSTGYLYLSADMPVPVVVADTSQYQRQDSTGVRRYGDNTLRKSETGLWELKVTGDAFHRGYAIGKLSKDLLYYQEKVFVDQIREIVPSESYLKFLRFFIAIFNRNLSKHVADEFREEIYGISLSCTSEYDFIGSPYERQMNYHAAHDIGHAMQDYMLVGCTSFASWGTHSADSALIVGRNFDFYMGDEFALNKQVAFYFPDSGYKFAAVGWPGMTGVLSGMNEAGLTVTINAAKSAVPFSAATPISLLTREILQYASTIEEAYAVAKTRKTFVAESILVGSARDGKAAIIEKSPGRIALFSPRGEQLVSANHFQSSDFSRDKRNLENIRTSDSPYRYARMQELLEAAGPVDAQKAAAILRDRMGLAGEEIGLSNEMAINQFIGHHSVIFKPRDLLMWVSTSPWQSGRFVAYDLRRIFGGRADFTHEIYSPELTIAADSLQCGPILDRLLLYRKLTILIKKNTEQSRIMDEELLCRYKNSNPEMYYVYEVLGDYYQSVGNLPKAQSNWQQALTKSIPKQGERERILKKVQDPKFIVPNPEF